ncbi:MAG: hypothetical protein IKJ08_07110 [Alistipes sp.]|nr:hypothetical protein [Alistipes sp.]MBR4029337.1 hypothetical protein [Alistipes sp.]
MEVNIILEESAFIVEAEGKKLRVSYKEECLPYKEARKFCEENGGGDETVENLRFLAKHRDSINKVLNEKGRTELSGWYWSNEESWRYKESAFIVDSDDGYVNDNTMNLNDYVRAVSAL